MAEERTSVGFAGLEALVSDVSLDLSAAERDARPVEALPAPERPGTVAGQSAPIEQRTGVTAPNAPSLKTVLWIGGGVLALVWVCSSVNPRSPSYRGATQPSSYSSSPSSLPFPPKSAGPADSQASGAVSRGRGTGDQSPPSDLYSYVDEDGILHFSNTKVDSRYRRVESEQKAKTGSGARGTVSSPTTGKLDRFRAHVRAAAEKYRLPETLLLAVMAVESDYDHRALSADGRMGLMQLSPQVAKDMYVSDAWDPAQNIEGGARYLRVLSNEFKGDPVQVLAAYDAGPEAVRQAGGAIPNVPKTREFVRKVVELWKAFEASGGTKTAGVGGATGDQPPPRPTPAGDTYASLIETKPSVGEGRALSINEIRYCVFESERIERMKPLASSNARIDIFNEYVRDYNSRCGRFRYRRGTLEQVRREAAQRATSLEQEAHRRFY